jgi:hypothetical protein
MAHPDLDALLDYCIGFAQQQLRKHGEFFPFGASIGPDGKLAVDAVLIDDEHPPSQAVIDMYTEMYRARAGTGDLHAAALCWDSRVSIGDGPKTDAISIGLEHINRESVTACVPYKKSLLRGFQYGNVASTHRELQFFS